ncbi:MAG: hypothetical protein F4003_08990 [Acidimicrobiaceae bacterium]|nr:hypothetical protein [Acidimicrobiaceae bacterium]MYC43806.1 hypothetical protein [Acidimicrobiaceae bacterium]
MNRKLYREPIDSNFDDPLAGLSDWLADCQVDEAAASRARQRSLEQQATQESCVAGVLLDLAERGLPATVKTAGGQVCKGQIIAVGSDFVFVRGHEGDLLIPTRAVATIRTSPTDRPVTGARQASPMVLVDTLDELVADQASVVVTVGDDCVDGRLQAVGTDVIAVAVGKGRKELVHIATAAIERVLVAGR